ncbi:MAG: YjbE family putative metal transport protein, partial [Caulobacteraceae bacterium]
MIPPLSHWAGSAAALVQVVIIDLTMAGDNAVAVGLTAARLPPKQRHRAMVLGLAAAVVMLIGFALVAVQLLKILGLLLAGGLLLLWVCWRMWRELRAHDLARGESAEAQGAAVKPKSTRQALLEILAADLSMSLDNVLGVAGAARDHPIVLVVVLLLSITLTGL